MAKNNNLTDFFRDLADGIRQKENVPDTRKMNPQDFRDHINAFPSARQYRRYLAPLNQILTIAFNDSFMTETIDGVPLWVYYDERHGRQLFPVLNFSFSLETFLPGVEVTISDYTTDGVIATLSESSPLVTVPVVAFCNTSQNNRFDMPGIVVTAVSDSGGSGNVTVKMVCEWVTMGLPYNSAGDTPIFSAATMGGIVEK